MSLLALAFPELKQVDYNFIQTFRKKNDEFYFNLVKPHFSVVSPVDGVAVDSILEEMRNKLSPINRFDFSIRCAVMSKDAFSENYYVRLVPDKGLSNFVKIHDKLYDGILAPHLNLDVDYIPHISIGTLNNKNNCKILVDGINKEYLCIRGKINSVDLVSFENNAITQIERIKLK